jgi:hypothetical protein
MRPNPVAIALVALLFGSGCLPTRNVPTEDPTPTAASEWAVAYSRATANANEAKLAAADRALLEFAQRFPGTAEAAEVSYWRAVFKLDPGNAALLRESMTLLESYLTSAPAGTHRVEASALHRLGVALEQRNAAVVATPPAPTVRPEDKARDEELQRLRDELAKANAELERIRRRLARPRP